MAEQQNVNDSDVGKGAVEGDGRGRTDAEQNGNTSLSGQNPHRVNSRLVKANDSDFPEPGSSPEHSGRVFELDQHGRPHQQTGVVQRGSTLSHEEPGTMNENSRQLPESNRPGGANAAHSPERDQVDQDPGERQKENQNKSKDDPLAA